MTLEGWKKNEEVHVKLFQCLNYYKITNTSCSDAGYDYLKGTG